MSYAKVLRLLLRLLGKMCRVYGYWLVNGGLCHRCKAAPER
jgi:hypothetical protein